MGQDGFLHVNLVIQVIRKPHLLDVKVFLQQLLFLQCHDIIGVDQLLDRVHHLVKACRDLSDLSAGRHRNLLLKIPFFKAFHRNAQFL